MSNSLCQRIASHCASMRQNEVIPDNTKATRLAVQIVCVAGVRIVGVKPHCPHSQHRLADGRPFDAPQQPGHMRCRVRWHRAMKSVQGKYALRAGGHLLLLHHQHLFLLQELPLGLRAPLRCTRRGLAAPHMYA